MLTLTDSVLLVIYEAGQYQSLQDRAVTILAATFPEESPAILGRLTPGQRDARLLALRRASFGLEMPGVTTCSICGQILEFSLNTLDLSTTAMNTDSSLTRDIVESDGYTVTFRLPFLEDLIEIKPSSDGTIDPIVARLQLLEHCLISAQHDGKTVEFAAIPQLILELVVQRMADLDPQGDLTLDLKCIACGNSWQAVFNVVAYLWDEICLRAGELLQEVHLLARAYGWNESDILALGSWRRRIYLELAYG